MSIIEELRSFHGIDNDYQDNVFWEIDAILNTYKPSRYSVDVKERDFKESGRWSNWKAIVYKVTENGEEIYFKLGYEIPASECQEGMDLPYSFYEVVPQEVTVVQYVVKKGAV